ncbi:hypothetical protein HCH_03941 [Hahella chejuensis KCTC 2396]|uniref:Uncharacterized protein n=1 Tax=Hahella chejuensis (strain KCTC 2396) TaxID=349521 RepID=Q2SFB2_HAHCH|nr:hypothetical protein HCH_03941 [Hahella chejuensis KCTC 2396]
MVPLLFLTLNQCRQKKAGGDCLCALAARICRQPFPKSASA